LVATAVSTVTAYEDVACAGFPCQSEANFPSGFNVRNPNQKILPIDTINDIQPPNGFMGPGEDVYVSEYAAVTTSNNLGTSFPVNVALIGTQNAKPTRGAPAFFGDESRSVLGTIFILMEIYSILSHSRNKMK